MTGRDKQLERWMFIILQTALNISLLILFSLVLNHFDPTCVWQEVFNPDNLNNSIIGYDLAHVCLLKNK